MLHSFFFGKKLRQSIDPSEVVAVGATKHASKVKAKLNSEQPFKDHQDMEGTFMNSDHNSMSETKHFLPAVGKGGTDKAGRDSLASLDLLPAPHNDPDGYQSS